MEFAQMWARRSVCSRLHVGAVITTEDLRQVVAIGYNGLAKGLPHDRCTGELGRCGCIHAEINAIAQADSRIPRKVLFVTTAPCVMCAQLIVQNGIARVVYRSQYRDGGGLDLLRDLGIEVEKFE